MKKTGFSSLTMWTDDVIEVCELVRAFLLITLLMSFKPFSKESRIYHIDKFKKFNLHEKINLPLS